jgi:hypothetical protein
VLAGIATLIVYGIWFRSAEHMAMFGVPSLGLMAGGFALMMPGALLIVSSARERTTVTTEPRSARADDEG